MGLSIEEAAFVAFTDMQVRLELPLYSKIESMDESCFSKVSESNLLRRYLVKHPIASFIDKLFIHKSSDLNFYAYICSMETELMYDSYNYYYDLALNLATESDSDRNNILLEDEFESLMVSVEEMFP